MNHLLEFTGSVLYMLLSIILLPLFLLVQFLLWTVPALKFIKITSLKIIRYKSKRTYQIPHFIDLVFERLAKKHL